MTTTRFTKGIIMIKILKVVDNEDGSAKVEFDCDEKTYHQIFEHGFIALLKKGIESEEDPNL